MCVLFMYCFLCICILSMTESTPWNLIGWILCHRRTSNDEQTLCVFILKSVSSSNSSSPPHTSQLLTLFISVYKWKLSIFSWLFKWWYVSCSMYTVQQKFFNRYWMTSVFDWRSFLNIPTECRRQNLRLRWLYIEIGTFKIAHKPI